jgi:hypothetical protein
LISRAIGNTLVIAQAERGAGSTVRGIQTAGTIRVARDSDSSIIVIPTWCGRKALGVIKDESGAVIAVIASNCRRTVGAIDVQ